MTTSTVIIGGKELTVPELNFKALKKIYPIISKMKVFSEEEMAAQPDLAMSAIDETIKVISIALERSTAPMTVDEIEDKLVQSELAGLQSALVNILNVNGLTVKSGEPRPAGKAVKPSTETLMPSSAKSSRASAQPTGTA